MKILGQPDKVESVGTAFSGTDRCWNRIAEFADTTLADTFTWGLDLSGTMQGAGGVGGLLVTRWVSDVGQPDYFPTYDGNGNVSEYLGTTGANIVHYEYDPFGGLTRLTGNNSTRFQYRFSTKPRDLSTGLYYYGYRYYDPVTGRWPSRDPIGEEGGINLYGFVGNDGVNKWDYLGHKFVFEPLGSFDVETLFGIGTTGIAPWRVIMHIKCTCDSEDSDKWYPKLVMFLTQSYNVIATHVKTHRGVEKRSPNAIETTRKHEQVHSNNAKDWHGKYLPIAREEFSDKMVYSSKELCSAYVDSLEKTWFVRFDSAHRLARGHHDADYPDADYSLEDGGTSFPFAEPNPDGYKSPNNWNKINYKNYSNFPQ